MNAGYRRDLVLLSNKIQYVRRERHSSFMLSHYTICSICCQNSRESMFHSSMVKGYLSLYLLVHILLCASSMTILTIYNYVSFCFTASTVIISCIDACSLNNVTFPVCAFNNFSESFLQQGSKKQTVFLKIFINYSDFQNIPSICQVSETELQPCILNSTCESEDDMNVVHQGSRSEVPEVRGSLDMKAKKFISFHKHFNFTMGYVNEESEEYNTYYIVEVLRNSTTRKGNTTEENINHSCIAAMMEDQNGCINISLQLQPYVENPMCMPKIIWLVLIPFVFVLTIITVTYKVFQENKKHIHSKYRATAASVIQQKDSKSSKESTSTNIIQLLSEPNQRRPTAITQTAEILPAIPEHEHSQQA
ncbi:transmembrane protein 156 isoform X1 [Gopherus flavomarginatus]|uniref:transmembrane protein 156 isoform X1 n=1 Tax=Gopherus flavomarginatus TaxID=286002 RepID=UPI0021CBD49F|nr:transmembrane protein 156 isoform X1 [Gopherus flavomarginatus]